MSLLCSYINILTVLQSPAFQITNIPHNLTYIHKQFYTLISDTVYRFRCVQQRKSPGY